MKRREIKEEVSKQFLLSLLEPYHPTLKPGEKITDIDITDNENSSIPSYVIHYVIVKEGGVKNS